MYSGGSGLSIDIHFVDIDLSYDVLSPLPTLLSKHFNHPHPYIEIAVHPHPYIEIAVCYRNLSYVRRGLCGPPFFFYGVRCAQYKVHAQCSFAALAPHMPCMLLVVVFCMLDGQNY